MKKILFSFLLFSGSFRATAQTNDIDVLHYKFELELNDQSDTIKGKATIFLRFLHRSESILLDFAAQPTKGKGMVSYPRFPNGKTIPANPTPGKLLLKLPKEARVGDTMTIIIDYKGIPSDGLIISKNKYGKRTFFADNWPNRGHNWLPCHDDPADKAPVEFIITAPQHYQVVANGIQIEETNLADNKKRTHWKEDVPISTKVMVIGVADFAVNLSGTVNGCIPVYSWVYPEDRDKGFYDYAMAADILPWFIKNVGPYGYKKLANVQSKTTFGGLENANTIFYSENSVSGNRNSEGLIAHEIAHQWFGNMATEKTFAHLWLSEGFATYMTILYMESKYGKDKATAMLIEDRDQVISFAQKNKRPVVDHTTDYMSLLNANSYQKGGWILHMLRHELGDSIFWKSIQKYYATYGGKTADSDDLRKIFEDVSGTRLENFFAQWLNGSGIPILGIVWQYEEKEKNLVVTVTQRQSIPFRFPLELLIKTSKKNHLEKLMVTMATQTFKIPLTEKPSLITPDPNTGLLFQWVH